MGLKGRSSVKEIPQNLTASLKAIPEEDSQRCFQQWQDGRAVLFTYPFYKNDA
jgi:hypothetical protein